MDKIHIRPYQEGDFDRLAEIHDPARQSELALAGLSEAFVPLSIAADREGLFDYTVCIAEYEGSFAGFVAFEDEELAWLYVDPACTRRGIGTQLVEYALKQMAEDVSIEVLSGNTPAIALYEKCGFEITETLTGVMPGNEEFPVTVHVMKKAPKILPSTKEDNKRIHDMLIEYNLRYMHDFDDYDFHIEENGEIIGGIVAWSVADTLEVEYLRIDDRHRKQGLGTRLLTHVEDLARERGLKRVRLNTLSFQAPEFYKSLGYMEQFVSPAFDAYTHIYLIKDL